MAIAEVDTDVIVVIDTNIIIKAFREAEQDRLRVATLIGRKQFKLGCDNGHEGEIIKEYKKHLEGCMFYEKWFQRLMQLQAIRHLSSYKLHKKHIKSLSKHECRQASDLVFIGVAYHSGKILVSEDSDVGKGPKGNQPPHTEALAYLTQQMGLKIWDAREACEQLER